MVLLIFSCFVEVIIWSNGVFPWHSLVQNNMAQSGAALQCFVFLYIQISSLWVGSIVCIHRVWSCGGTQETPQIHTTLSCVYACVCVYYIDLADACIQSNLHERTIEELLQWKSFLAMDTLCNPWAQIRCLYCKLCLRLSDDYMYVCVHCYTTHRWWFFLTNHQPICSVSRSLYSIGLIHLEPWLR